MRLRGFAKARIGPKNEQISRFGVAPLRKRPSRAKKEGQIVAPPPETPAPAPTPARGGEQKGGETVA